MKTFAILLNFSATTRRRKTHRLEYSGMHCMDDDLFRFLDLPALQDALLPADRRTGPSSHQRRNGIVVTYEAIADPDGSINTTSVGKTNFWQYSPCPSMVPPPAGYRWPFPEGNPGKSVRTNTADDEL